MLPALISCFAPDSPASPSWKVRMVEPPVSFILEDVATTLTAGGLSCPVNELSAPSVSPSPSITNAKTTASESTTIDSALVIFISIVSSSS